MKKLAIAIACALLVPTGAVGAQQRATTYSFSDVTASAGIADTPPRTWGLNWADYDGDGNSDLFVNYHWFEPRLWRNLGDGSYVRMSDPDFYPSEMDRHACVWGEANGDRLPDLYCTQGADKGEGSGANQLLVQTATGFDDRTRAFRVRDAFGRGRTVNWFDYDTDGDLDLFVGNEARSGYPNVLFENTGGSFRKVDAGLSDELATIGSSWSDWDNDGDPDLLVLQRGGGTSVAYENVGGRFRRTALGFLSGRTWKSAAWGDFDGDGWTDLHVLNRARSVVLRNDHGTFAPVAEQGLVKGRMSAWIDAENDGDLDLFVVQGHDRGINQRDFLLVSSDGAFSKLVDASVRGATAGDGDAVAVGDHDGDGLADVMVTNGHLCGPQSGGLPPCGPLVLLENRSVAGNAVTLDLVGDPGNPWGFAARVQVTSATQSYRREITDGFNFRAQSDVSELLLGIGQDAAAEITVTWPDGSTDCITALAGERAVVVKGTLPCP